MEVSRLIDYLPQKGILSEMFIPVPAEIPEFCIPTWGNAQLTLNVQKPYLLTAVNLHYDVTFPGGDVVATIAIATPGVGMNPGVYIIDGVGGGGEGSRIQVTVNGDGTVHAGGAVILLPGSGYVAPPTFTMPVGAGGAPPATFTATVSPSGLGPWTGQPTIQIYQNHRKVQLQLLSKSGFAPSTFGTADNPGYLQTPHLFAKHDQITVECSYTSVFPGYNGASNTDPNYLYCYLTMIGGEPR